MSEAISRQIVLHGAFTRLQGAPEAGERRIIAGYASVPIVDSFKTIFTLEALQGALDDFMQHPVLRYMHDQPVGLVIEAYEDSNGIVHKTHIDDNGLYVVAELAHGTQLADDAWTLIQQGVITGFSIGGSVENPERDIEFKQIDGERVGIIHRLKLNEISIVDLPANEAARFKIVRQEDLQSAPDSGAQEEKRGISMEEEKEEEIRGAEILRWSWDACMSEMKSEGYSEETAAKICAAIKNRTVRHMVEYGLAGDYQEALELLKRKLQEDAIFGYVVSRLKEAYMKLQRYEGEESMEEESVKRQEGAAEAPADQPAQAPAPQAPPAEQQSPSIEDRVGALEQRMAGVEAAIAELREMVQAALTPEGETAETTGAAPEAPVNESIERRMGANIVAQASAGIDISRASRSDLLKALAEAEKGRM